ncbi:unnamed protein product [Orchesella dallaii]|uniref:Uncharacterized protein n=1 Tax=Orchesella dallaii TaxID=48710 RepID=A0ABP1PKR1_9HEXA
MGGKGKGKGKGKGEEGWGSQTPGWGHDENGGWSGGWGEERPAYDINPHFGFRQYSEMRYEPLTVPFLYSTQVAPGPPAPAPPVAPLFLGQGAPYLPAYLPGGTTGIPPQYGGLVGAASAKPYLGGLDGLFT